MNDAEIDGYVLGIPCTVRRSRTATPEKSDIHIVHFIAPVCDAANYSFQGVGAGLLGRSFVNQVC